MKDFFSWIAEAKPLRPWLIVGKGPTFARRTEANLAHYNVIGLNHIVREIPVQLAHIIDIDVVGELGPAIRNAGMVVMPLHPHVNFNATPRPLDAFFGEYPVLKELDRDGLLLWYNLSTWPHTARRESPIVAVKYFSAEAAVRLLAMAGVKKIRTLGIDGGSAYADEFKDIKPFRGGHTSFDLQWESIRATVKEFKIDFAPLFTLEENRT